MSPTTWLKLKSLSDELDMYLQFRVLATEHQPRIEEIIMEMKGLLQIV